MVVDDPSFPSQVTIRGMTCSSCVHTIETRLAKLPGIQAVSVTLNTERGKIRSGLANE